jgi:hypothetical protein
VQSPCKARSTKPHPPLPRQGRSAGRPALTTQLYFPGEWRNRWDIFFRRRLLMDVDDGPDGKRARYDFVLDLG